MEYDMTLKAMSRAKDILRNRLIKKRILIEALKFEQGLLEEEKRQARSRQKWVNIRISEIKNLTR